MEIHYCTRTVYCVPSFALALLELDVMAQKFSHLFDNYR